MENYSEWFEQLLGDIVSNQYTDKGWLYGVGENEKEYFLEDSIAMDLEGHTYTFFVCLI